MEVERDPIDERGDTVWQDLDGPLCDKGRQGVQCHNPGRNHGSKVFPKKRTKRNVFPTLDVAG